MLLSPEFVSTLYTPKYLGSVPIMRINLWLLLTSIFVTDAVVRAFAEYRYWFLRVRFLMLALQILLSVVLLPYVGMGGALLAVVIATVIERIINVRLVFRALEFQPQHRSIFRAFALLFLISALAGVAMLAALAILPAQQPAARLVTGIITFALVYIVTILISGFLNREEQDLLKRFASKLLGFFNPTLAARVQQL